MLLKYGQINILCEALHRMNTVTGEAGWAIGRSLMELDREYCVFQDYKMKVFQKYGEQMEDGGYVIKDEDKRNAAITELDAILNKEVDINLCRIKFEDYNPDDMKCLTAQAGDYRIFEEFLVEPKRGETS